MWTPQGEDLKFVPPEVKQAIVDLIEPIYRQTVLGAADPLEKSLGVSLTHLLWLEILDQFDIKKEYVAIELRLEINGNRQDAIAHHLRLLESKIRIGQFLLHWREFCERMALRAPPPAPPLPLPQALSFPGYNTDGETVNDHNPLAIKEEL